MRVCDYFDKKEEFEKLIVQFFKYLCENELEIYNEFSFQHELGIFFREKFRVNCEDFKEYKIEFERNAKKYFHVNYAMVEDQKLKKEIDLVVYKKDHSLQYAVELKFPLNGQYPEQMFNFVKDVRFMQELVNQKIFKRTYCITLVWAVGKGRPFFRGGIEGSRGVDIYKYFRNENNLLYGKIIKPTGLNSNKYIVDLQDKVYPFTWKSCQIINGRARSDRYKYRNCKYYIIECK